MTERHYTEVIMLLTLKNKSVISFRTSKKGRKLPFLIVDDWVYPLTVISLITPAATVVPISRIANLPSSGKSVYDSTEIG